MTLFAGGRPASVQVTHVGIESISGGVVSLTGGALRAVLELRSLDSAPQGRDARAAALAGFASFLSGRDYPIQLLLRVVPLDLERHAARVERRAVHDLDSPLADLALDQAGLLRRLARSLTLLERRVYVVVPAQPVRLRQDLLTRLFRPFRRNPGGRQADVREETVARSQLATRCAEVAQQLGRCDIDARRLGDAELVQLFSACWRPDHASLPRHRQSAADYEVLAVGVAGSPPPAGDVAAGYATAGRQPAGVERSR